MLSVTFFLSPQMLATSVTLPLEQLRAAETLDRAAAPKGRAKGLAVQLASVDGAPVKTHTGIPLAPTCAIDDIHECDLVLLPALWRNPRPVLKRCEAVLPWLVDQHEGGSQIAGVGTGCFFMAEAGLLDNRPATTHWHYFDEFQARYPLAELKRQHFITQAANLYCTGSVNSMADLTIHFIQRYFSRTVASHVERHFFHEIRRAYESSISFLGALETHPDEAILQIQLWLRENFEREVKVQDLAQLFGMSPRTLSRRFRSATGTTPLGYLQKIRMENARDLLQNSNLAIQEIIEQTGYHDMKHFNTLFKSHFGTTPSQYRTTVRAKLFSL